MRRDCNLVSGTVLCLPCVYRSCIRISEDYSAGNSIPINTCNIRETSLDVRRDVSSTGRTREFCSNLERTPF